MNHTFDFRCGARTPVGMPHVRVSTKQALIAFPQKRDAACLLLRAVLYVLYVGTGTTTVSASPARQRAINPFPPPGISPPHALLARDRPAAP